MIRVGIAGATGYTGIELVRLLSRHPQAKVVYATSEQYQDQPLTAVYPHLGGEVAVTAAALDAAELGRQCDVVFTALPHGVPLQIVPALLAAGARVIDLGADFRLRDGAEYAKWYGLEHTAPSELAQAVYGLPELFRDQVRGARLVANPGCYPTAAALAAAPLLQAGLVEPDSLIVDAKSGVSGAGRGLKVGVHFAEVYENFSAYGIAGTHRHTPEIEQTLAAVAGQPLTISFTPHLVPMVRGILVTLYGKLTRSVTTQEVLQVCAEHYDREWFVRIRPEGNIPQTKEVLGSNFCDIGARVDPRTGRVLVVAVIDNLVKGAAGQAVQNMNLQFGLAENTGLMHLPLYP